MSAEAGQGSGRRVVWAILAGSTVLTLAGWFVLRPPQTVPVSPAPAPEKYVVLLEPRGEIDSPPSLFTWQPVPGASRYSVKIADADTVWPLFVRPALSPGLSLDPKEVSAIRPGRMHVWEVEAYDEKGKLIASGGTRFRVKAPASPAS